MKLTQEEKRIKIAKVCGWKEIQQHPKTKVWFGIPPPDRKPQSDVLLPDYFNDLNAMHEAWKALSQSERMTFEGILDGLITGDAEWHDNDDRPLVTNATAAQRAEAFGLTLNLWDA